MAREDAYARAAQQNQALQGVSDFAAKGVSAYYGGQQAQNQRDWETEQRALDREAYKDIYKKR